MIIRFDKDQSNFHKLQNVKPVELKLKESWIQDLVVDHSTDIVGEPLLVISREFSGFHTKERPDILAIDVQGRMVVVELKRDVATEDAATETEVVELQRSRKYSVKMI